VVSTEIHPKDQMVNPEKPQGYFLIGESGLRCIQSFIGSSVPSTILDLPCGHGRVLRFMRDAYPEAQITACDIDREGVDFCAQTFGATPLYSSEDPTEIDVHKFDLIWCGSLLTHFDADRWDPWIRFFVEHLNPGGSFVFTTHGRTYIRGEIMTHMPSNFPELKAECERTGFSFNSRTETSLSSPEWVMRRLPNLQVRFVEQGWHGLQDAWCLTARKR
jgi:SAM-dependent methyltransferase